MHAPEPDRDPGFDTRRRWKWLGVLSGAALLLHAAAFGGLAWTWPQAEPVRLPAATLRVRVVDAPAAANRAVLPTQLPMALAPLMPSADAFDPAPPIAPQPLALAPQSLPPAPQPLSLAPSLPPRLAAPAPALRAKAIPVRASVAAVPPSSVDRPAPGSDSAPSAALQLALNTPTAGPAAAGDEAIPHYRTRMPPAATLRYEMQRGLLHGTGDLAWRPQGERYELRLDARVGGLAVLTQVSAGAFDAAGVAPLRFTDQRLRRGTTAANFQREAGKITFSGPATEFALRAGAQDRLSWMIQLAAIVGAEPHLATPGAKVVMYVVGSHGDASVWVFRCVGPEAVETRAGTLAAVKFVREPRESYDTTVQVWLDPKQHDLPVRATQKSGANDEGFDLRLLEVLPPS